MREYRIVGTKHMRHNSDGHESISMNIHPAISGYGSYNVTYQDRKIAESELEHCKLDIEFWTKCHNRQAEKDPKYGVIISWTDIHLESREVTEWEEV